MKPFKVIVFDFGNVIINIDVSKTIQAFASLTRKSIETVQRLFEETQLFKRYEIGELDDTDFRDFVRSLFNQPITDREIDEAWNALLLDIPTERLNLLAQLRSKYPVYLLSNTSPIHIRQATNYLRKSHQIMDLYAIFDKVFLSYEMNLWKPDPDIYLQMLRNINQNAADVLFLDDNVANIEAAKKIGINAVLIEPDKLTICDYFNNQ